MTELLTKENSIKIEDNTFYDAPSYNPFILVNSQLIKNGSEIATDGMKIFNEYVLKLMKFDMTAMRMLWTPFLLGLSFLLLRR